MVKQSIVLYPSPAIGHLISMVELGKLILKHHPSFSITILVTTPPYNTGSTTPYINHASQTEPLINFHHLPIVTLPLDSPSKKSHMEDLAFQLLRLNNPLVHQALQSISQTSTIKALVIDVFCTPALEVASVLNIPAFYFFTSGISCLALLLHFPTIHNSNTTTTTTKSFKDLKDTYINIPGLPPVLASDMPQAFLDRTDKVYDAFHYLTTHLPMSQGILVNSFESLEPRALKTIQEGLCVPDAPTPPIFSIGPLIADRDASGEGDECLTWLNAQPRHTVVFLCFGSLGLFSKEQLQDIALGLEMSRERFLWVVRSPPTEDKVKRFLAPPEPDLNELLPEGFMDRTADRGLVIKSWAPQTDVLNHEAVGGFVTHCGWNSVLEAIHAGVPMVAWPLYAEQRANKVFMVEEMKIALPMEESEHGGVKACQVEKGIKQLMDSDKGKMIREQTMRMSDAAKAALEEGGSSLRALSELTELWNVRQPSSGTKTMAEKTKMLSPNVPIMGSLPANVRMPA